MSSLNRVTLLGHLGADPELRTTQSGEPVCNLRVATTDAWSDKDGNRQERTEWHAVTVFGKQADSCGRFLAKGRQVLVEGRIQSRKYTNREGVECRATEIVASNVLFVGEAPRGGDSTRAPAVPSHPTNPEPTPSSPQSNAPAGKPSFDDDPIPF